MIDSAEVTANQVALNLGETLFLGASSISDFAAVRVPIRFFATDGVERFQALGSRFLGEPVKHVELVDLGG